MDPNSQFRMIYANGSSVPYERRDIKFDEKEEQMRDSIDWNDLSN